MSTFTFDKVCILMSLTCTLTSVKDLNTFSRLTECAYCAFACIISDVVNQAACVRFAYLL